MAQDFVEDSYQPDHIADTDMGDQRDNDKALKSSFSGISSPSNDEDGMPWCDTANGLLKMSYSGSWKTIFDLVNNRALVALLATNCSRSVLAGAGLSGGGELSADRTITHPAHTGDVTGQSALTIGAGKVTPGHVSDGLGMISVDSALGGNEVSASPSKSWQNVHQIRIKCPASPTNIRLWANVKSDNAFGYVYVRLNTAVGVSSLIGTRQANTYGWVDCGVVNFAAGVAGTIYDLSIQMYPNTEASGFGTKMQGYSLWWE